VEVDAAVVAVGVVVAEVVVVVCFFLAHASGLRTEPFFLLRRKAGTDVG
jgi:hypothetical protein